MTNRTDSFAWGDPPRAPRPERRTPAWVAQLKAHPQQWARITKRHSRDAASAYAYAIREGIVAYAQPAGAFEAKSRTVDGEFVVYARYVGAPEGGAK